LQFQQTENPDADGPALGLQNGFIYDLRFQAMNFRQLFFEKKLGDKNCQ